MKNLACVRTQAVLAILPEFNVFEKSFYIYTLAFVRLTAYNYIRMKLRNNERENTMLEYMSAPEAAKKWGISERRVEVLCSENRIPGAAKLSRMWLIPKEAEKPVDRRHRKRGDYIDKDSDM